VHFLPVGRETLTVGRTNLRAVIDVDVAQLVLEYLKVLAWPLVVVALGLLYRRQVVGVLARLKKTELPGGVALDFSEEAREVDRPDGGQHTTCARSPSVASKYAGWPIA
jgi:hypothetical protein